MSTAPNTTKKKKMSPYKLRGRLADFGYALPALLFFIVFTYYPVVELFRISLTNWNLMKDNYAYVGFKNYIWLFSSTGTGLKRLTSSLSVTFLYTLGEVFGSCVLGLLLALLFNRMSRSFKIMRTLVILPKYVTISASALVFLWLYNESYGVFNQLYTALGVTPVNWLGNKDTALLSVIVFPLYHRAADCADHPVPGRYLLPGGHESVPDHRDADRRRPLRGDQRDRILDLFAGL